MQEHLTILYKQLERALRLRDTVGINRATMQIYITEQIIKRLQQHEQQQQEITK